MLPNGCHAVRGVLGLGPQKRKIPPLDLDPERVLVTHGDPVLADSRAKLSPPCAASRGIGAATADIPSETPHLRWRWPRDARVRREGRRESCSSEPLTPVIG